MYEVINMVTGQVIEGFIDAVAAVKHARNMGHGHCARNIVTGKILSINEGYGHKLEAAAHAYNDRIKATGRIPTPPWGTAL